jgi:hypothetical protein
VATAESGIGPFSIRLLQPSLFLLSEPEAVVMYFRFGSALVLVVLISLAGIALEKRNLDLRRAATRQRFRRDVLHDTHIRMRLETQRLGAPAQTIDALESGELRVEPHGKPPVKRGDQ